jgi:hypothetical protein
MASQASKGLIACGKFSSSIKMDEPGVEREQEIAQPSLIIAAPALCSAGQ